MQPWADEGSLTTQHLEVEEAQGGCRGRAARQSPGLAQGSLPDTVSARRLPGQLPFLPSAVLL